jgi:hypothetical protein
MCSMYTRTNGDIQTFLAFTTGSIFTNTSPTDTGEKKLPSQAQNTSGFLLKMRSWHAFWQFGVFRFIIATGITLLFAAFTQFFAISGTARWLRRLGAVCGLVTSLYFIGVALVPLNKYGLLHNLFLYTASLTFIIPYLLLFLAVLLSPGFPRRCVYAFTAFAVLLAGSLLVFIFTLFFGPAAGTPAWEIIHASGQKLIVFASILTGLMEIFFVQPLLRENAKLASNMLG